MYKCKYFIIQELVSKKVYDYYTKTLKYPESFLWCLFDEEILKDLDLIRETRKKAIIINNWHLGGDLQQCGLRSNVEEIVKAKRNPYLSGHCLAKGFDLHDRNGDNKGLYNHVYNLGKEGKFKKIKRVENFSSTPTWCHCDGIDTADGKFQIFSI